MLVRDLQPRDLAAVHAINEENVPAVGSVSLEQLQSLVDRALVALVVVVDENRIAGFCIVLPPGTDYTSPNYLFFDERYDSFAYLDRVALTAGSRGHGWGKAMYDEVERRVAADWFTLEVNLQPRNDGSLRFHAREGFVEVGRQQPYPGNEVSLLAKRLR